MDRDQSDPAAGPPTPAPATPPTDPWAGWTPPADLPVLDQGQRGDAVALSATGAMRLTWPASTSWCRPLIPADGDPPTAADAGHVRAALARSLHAALAGTPPPRAGMAAPARSPWGAATASTPPDMAAIRATLARLGPPPAPLGPEDVERMRTLVGGGDKRLFVHFGDLRSFAAAIERAGVELLPDAIHPGRATLAGVDGLRCEQRAGWTLVGTPAAFRRLDADHPPIGTEIDRKTDF